MFCHGSFIGTIPKGNLACEEAPHEVPLALSSCCSLPAGFSTRPSPRWTLVRCSPADLRFFSFRCFLFVQSDPSFEPPFPTTHPCTHDPPLPTIPTRTKRRNSLGYRPCSSRHGVTKCDRHRRTSDRTSPTSHRITSLPISQSWTEERRKRHGVEQGGETRGAAPRQA